METAGAMNIPTLVFVFARRIVKVFSLLQSPPHTPFWQQGVLLLIFVCSPLTFGKSKKLLYCAEGSPRFFNPQLTSDGPSFDMSAGLYDRLVEFNKKKGGVRPGLARSWSVSKDKLTYTFRLRKNVSFHHTSYFKPTRFFNADDVLFSFNRQMDKQHSYYSVNGGVYPYFNSLGMGKLIKKIIKKNPYTIQFVLHRKEAVFLINLAMEFASILSKEYADHLLKIKKPELLDFRPVGTGPFVFQRYIKDSTLYLETHQKYFRGASRLKGIVSVIVPDSSVRFQKLKAGECDMISQPSPLDLPAMEKHPRIKLSGGKRYNIAYLAMNTQKGPFKNRKVRRAVHHALNRAVYIPAVYQGYAELAKNPYPSSLWSYNHKVKDYEYSLEKAKKLLKEAGYEKGFKTTLWTLPIARPYNPNGKKMGELMQADLKQIGIKARLISYDWPTYISRAGKGEHEMIQMGWTSDNGDPDNFLRPLLTCGSVSSGINLARWCYPPFDRLIEQALKINSQKARSRFYKKAQAVFKQEAPWVTLVHTYDYTALRKKVEGYVRGAFGSKIFYPVHFAKN